MGRVPGLHIRQVVVHLTEAGPPQLAALVDQPEHLHIQGHGEHHQIGGQHGAVVVAGLGMHLKHLNSRQGSEGCGGLVQAVKVVADRAHAAHEHQLQGLVVMRRAGQGGGDQELLDALLDCGAEGMVCGLLVAR